jgi:hypothetical protein
MNTENNNKITAMELYENFCLPAIVGGEEFTSDELADEMEGLHLTFPRIKIPAGGSLQFELPSDDPENPDYTKTLEGVIIFNHSSNALWVEGSEDDENNTPLCSSVNGKIGYGEPGGECENCALNEFGSSENGKGKACKNMRVLYLLRDGDEVPTQIILPPTSIKPFSDFYSSTFATRHRGAFGSIISIGLKRIDNGNTYSVATFRKVFDFTGEQLARAKAYSNGFKEQLKIINQQRIAQIENRSGDELNGFDERNIYSDNGQFEISATGKNIDGDVDDLPV